MKRKKEIARKRSKTIPVLDTRGLSLLSDMLNSMDMLEIGSNLTLASAGSFYDFSLIAEMLSSISKEGLMRLYGKAGK